ncbi:alpha-2-macroglobulin-like protein 1 [Haliotis rubra]|uniref:alpha-2-macroglobulin-like protein 1 n=1 Tax=Haliotis rubra TaxID=36100 RepID=UPI001EE58B8A|nr:alpha-2-macroglobulin-like protein 1 [Haliotis rubra]
MTLSPPKRVDDKTEAIKGEVCCKYTYGQPVKGKVMVETCVTELYQTYKTSTKPCVVIHGEMTGCFSYSFDVAILRPHYQDRYNYLKISTFAAVLEEATGLIVNQTKEGPTITTFTIQADVSSYTRKFFKPQLPFEYRLTEADSTTRNPVSFEATQWFSPSDSYIEIQPISRTISPGLQPVVLYLTNPPKTAFRVITQVMSRGRIMHHSQDKYRVMKPADGTYKRSQPWCRNLKYCSSDKRFAPDVPSIKIELNVSCSMAPEATLLVYHIRPDGEVVADTESFKVEQCFTNPVKMAFTPSKEYPGYPTQLSLSAAPGSLCMVGVVDQSVYLLGGKNQITPKQLFSPLEHYNAIKDAPADSYTTLTRYCEAWFKKHGVVNSDELKFNVPHYAYLNTRFTYLSDYVDSSVAFKLSSLHIFGLLELRSRPCKKQFTYNMYRHRRSLGSALNDWQSDQSEGSGGRSLDHCVSESASVTAFQPFFVSFTLPYAAVRGEYIPLTVTVFNYLTECIEIELRLNDSNEFDLLNPERVTWMCICGNEAKRHDFVIVPKNIGHINVTAQAKSIPGDSQCPKVTATGEAIGIKDAVVRQLLVEVRQYYTYR